MVKEKNPFYGAGYAHGTIWAPAEVDVSMRKGWFYHDNQKPKLLGELLYIYYNSSKEKIKNSVRSSGKRRLADEKP